MASRFSESVGRWGGQQVPRLRVAIDKANRNAALGMTELYRMAEICGSSLAFPSGERGAGEEKQVPRLRVAIDKANRNAALGMTELYRTNRNAALGMKLYRTNRKAALGMTGILTA